MNEVYQVYQRGFLGKVIHIVKQTSETDDILRKLKNIQFNPQVFVKAEENPVFNEEVESLYASFIKGGPGLNNVDFHEKIIEAFIGAFGTVSAMEWLEIQQQSPKASYLHAKFLLDTLKFVSGGQREMALTSWESLLNSSTPDKDWADVLGYAKQMDKDFAPITLVRDLAVRWCQQENGLSDMLYTLHILFGR